jgi:maleylpyruvate isomerase
VPQHLPTGKVVSDPVEWMHAGERFFRHEAARATADLGTPSLLPGWSRAHVLAHLIGSSEALGNLLQWARTGIETPMYASVEARAADIERRAALPPAELIAAVSTASDELLATVDNLPTEAWEATVRTVQGRTIPAAEMPWMRCRESWIHGVDLACGAWFDEFPEALVDALLDDVTAKLAERDSCPGVVLAPVDRDRMWPFGGPDPATVRGTAGDLLGWLLGRPVRPDSTLDADRPELPRWL